MPYQNRVNPFGQIITSSARGAWMGNRGILHKNKVIVRNYKLPSWIVCKLEFKGRRRTIMSENNYTELFFLDEATAYSAGHRPCAECRRDAFTLFKNAWKAANKNTYALPDDKIISIDKIIHHERIDQNGNKITYKEQLQYLPNGVFVKLAESDDSYLYYDHKLLKWNEANYSEMLQLPLITFVDVLTPKSIVKMFALGFEVNIHHSAKQLLNS